MEMFLLFKLSHFMRWYRRERLNILDSIVRCGPITLIQPEDVSESVLFGSQHTSLLKWNKSQFAFFPPELLVDIVSNFNEIELFIVDTFVGVSSPDNCSSEHQHSLSPAVCPGWVLNLHTRRKQSPH